MNILRIEPLDEAGRLAMRTGYHTRFVELAQKIPGMQWSARDGAWIGYHDAVMPLVAQLESERIVKLAGNRPPLRVPRSVPDKFAQYGVREYQKTGAQFLLDTAYEGVFLADGMGIGKTRQTLISLAEGLELPAVIVCPANVKGGWVEEAKKIGLSVHPLFGMNPPKDAQLAKDDGIVCLNYELVESWLPHLKGIKTIAFDEAQLLANEKSKRSKACKELAKIAKNRIALSGTPFLNRPKELWNIVDTISPNRFGKWMPYMKRYAGAFQEDVPVRGGEEGETQKVWNTKGASHTDELSARLKHFMLRRTKQDVALEIPAKTRKLVELDVSKAYKNPDRWWSLENTNQAQIALGLAAEGKIDHAVELAVEAVNSGSSPTLWVHRKEVSKLLRKRLIKEDINVFMITGDETPARRQQNAEIAKEQGNAVCIATFEAAGTGVNYLSFSDIAIFVELHYVPGKMQQAEDRHHRPGQIKPVTIYYLIGMETIDELIRDAVLRKLQAFEDVVGNVGDTIRTDLLGMSDEDAMDQLRRTLMEDEG